MDDSAATRRRRSRSRVDAPAHGATVGHIVERLRDDVLARRLTPGDRLVESDLTQRFAVSRGPVREALRRLAAEGLIEHAPNRGAVVRRLSPRDICELFQIRFEIEALAARLAAQSADMAARARFSEEIAMIFTDTPRRMSDYLDENAAFHAAVLRLADNAQLAEVSARLRLPLIMAQVGDALTVEVMNVSVCEHRAIAKAIIEGDATAAANAARAHLERAAALAVARREADAEPRN
ncbi:MAG: GntR family transcriptional regulator [Bradyrhizobium sp.]|nr:MAG: GntR family transcriptional regulator [Bradyrhizobium sp.]